MEDVVQSGTTIEPYTAKRFVDHALPLSARLLKGLLPNEIAFEGRTATMPDTFNAAWIVLNTLREFERALSAHSDDERTIAARNMNELVLKAIQTAEVQSWWHNRLSEVTK
jgi:hypothetical protein